MGGDYAPQNVVEGAFEALAHGHDFQIVFVGPEPVVVKAIAANAKSARYAGRYSIVHAEEIIDMHDSATASIRKKKESSIAIGVTLQKEERAEAFVSAGHTGAVMSASTLILGRIRGVSRPTIGTFFPCEQGVCLIFDAGANVDCKPQHLYEFGVMGSIYAREMQGFASPTVGLLSIGEEETKGNDVVKEAHQLLKASRLNFIGNIEGRDILRGKAQVIVCDGFVGNVILKFGESVPAFFKSAVRQTVKKSFVAMMFAPMMRGILRNALKSMDYEEYGGVPVLGVNGISIIGHGKSTPKAIRNMILKAEEMVRKNINKRIEEALSDNSAGDAA